MIDHCEIKVGMLGAGNRKGNIKEGTLTRRLQFEKVLRDQRRNKVGKRK